MLTNSPDVCVFIASGRLTLFTGFRRESEIFFDRISDHFKLLWLPVVEVIASSGVFSILPCGKPCLVPRVTLWLNLPSLYSGF